MKIIQLQNLLITGLFVMSFFLVVLFITCFKLDTHVSMIAWVPVEKNAKTPMRGFLCSHLNHFFPVSIDGSRAVSVSTVV